MVGAASEIPSGDGVFASQHLEVALAEEWISSDVEKIPSSSIQPASLDLRLGERAYRVRCSFLPDDETVERKMKPLVVDELDLRDDGAVLETNRPYLIPLIEELRLPSDVRARTNPKSSTGRLDVFTRVITDHSYQFDEIAPGYEGRLWLEVVPLSFTVRVKHRQALNQLRLARGTTSLTDAELEARHATEPLLYRHGEAVPAGDLATANGLFLSLDLRGDAQGRVGHQAKGNAPLLELGLVGGHDPNDYWDPVYRVGGEDRIILDPERFYLLLSDESVVVPPDLASEMTAYDPTSGELRTHYAGFFDPGFGYQVPDGHGSRAALEVRAHDVPFLIEHRQPVCKLTFERMLEPPQRLYGQGIGSHYQGQVETLGKHFRRATDAPHPSPEG
jgi:dCTP deaminase